MSIFESLASLFNDGSKGSHEKQQPNATKRNNDKNLLDNLSDSLGDAWKSITSGFSTSEPSPRENVKPEQNDPVTVAEKAAKRARESALEAQNLINQSLVGHNNQFQRGKPPNSSQADQKRKGPDSGFEQDPSQPKKPKTDDGNIQEFSDGTFRILPSLEKSISNAGESAREGKKMLQNIQNSWDNKKGFVGRHGNVNGQFDPHDKKGTAKFQREKRVLDRVNELQNARSLKKSRSESTLIAMREAQAVATGLAKSAKKDAEQLRRVSSQSGRSRTNVLSGKGGSARVW